MSRKFALASLIVASGLMTAVADDQPNQNQNRRNQPRAVADDFDNPSGIAIHPETGNIFVAEHRGVFRLYRTEGMRGWQRSEEIGGYPTDIYGKGPMYNIGPLGLAFVDDHHLVVGDGSRVDGEELLRVYDIEEAPLTTPMAEGDAEITLGPITAGEFTEKGEGNFYGIAVSQNAIYVTCNGDDTKGWISRATFTDAHAIDPLTPFIATKEAVEVDAPIAITLNGEGNLVVGQGGEVNVPGDSLLTIYNAESGELIASYETGLHDICGLAYDSTGRLFAVDYAWVDPTQGGLFELTIDGDYCEARKVIALDKPTAMAFEEDGDLYITCFGTAAEGDEELPGELWRIPQERLSGDAE
jgi:hypothetical protein